MEYIFRVMGCNLNKLHSNDGSNHDELLGERNNAWAAFALANKQSTHDYATWVIHIPSGRLMPSVEYAANLQYAIEDQIKSRDPKTVAAIRAVYARRGREHLFSIIGDGRPGREVDCEPIIYKRVTVNVAEYMGDGYWADFPPMEFPDAESAQAYARLVNANSQTGSKQKIRSIRYEYV